MKLINIFTFCLLVFALSACRKSEFMPVVEGQPVPHETPKINMKEALAASPYTLFKAAWERSNMDKIIKEKGNKFPYSLMVPTDAAFIADGLTLEVINKTSPAMLDSLLMYHALEGGVNPEDLKTSLGNVRMKALLENPFLKIKAPISLGLRNLPYFYLQYLKISNGELLINGKKAGATAPIQTKDGALWPINRVLHKPVKTIMQVLQEDGRFGMYLEMNERGDALFKELSFELIQHDFTLGLKVEGLYDYNIMFNSIFAIPDEAFHKAGFKTVDDIMALNDRNPLPYFDWDAFSMVGALATDSLIGYHRWGSMFSYYDANYGRGQDNATNFYSNELNNLLLSDYTLVSSGTGGAFPVYKMPLDFINEAGVTKVKVKGSEYPAATVVESDINTLMGPVHVVDRLILPPHFKL